MSEMGFHEAANIFPLEEKTIDVLAEDIRKHGQRETIKTLDGLILDGRRRYLACKRISVTPKFEAVKVDDPIAYSVSLNLHRRHLTTGQAAMCAARAKALKKKLEDEAKNRQREGGRSAGVSRPKKVPDNCREPFHDRHKNESLNKLGEQFGVSGKSVERALSVLEKGIPELGQALDAGKIAVNKAQYISTHEPELQKEMLEAELDQEQKTQHRAKPPREEPREIIDQPEEQPRNGKRSVATIRAQEAIDCLMRIPKNDPKRLLAFKIVKDWIRRHP